MDTMNMIGQLETVYHTMKTDGNYERARQTLEELIHINKLVQYYLNAVKDFSEEDKVIVELIIHILQEIYNNGAIESPISDETYDSLYALHLDINERDIVGASVGNVQDKVVSSHAYPDLRGTLDKIHFIRNVEKKPNEKRKSLEDWIKSIEKKLSASPHILKSLEIQLFPKWDGISGIFECDRNGDVQKVLKRGDTERNEAEEMTLMFKGKTNMSYLDDRKGESPFGVKTEIVMSRDDYDRLCEKYGSFKSPRSAVSSIINSKEFDPKYLEYLTIIPLQIQWSDTKIIDIPEFTYTKYPYIVSKLYDFDHIHESIDLLKTMVRDSIGIDIDGVVIRIRDSKIQASLGRESNINKYEVAYKLPPEQARTIIKDVEFSVGVLGAITPVAKIEPVKLKGNTISNISLGSIDRFESLRLHRGDGVVIKYDVIPYLDPDFSTKQLGGDIFVTPTHCPYCKELLVKQPVLRCINDDCESRIIGKIMNYVTKMSIPNISIGIITTLFKEGLLKSIIDLYRLENHRGTIIQMDGFGSKSFKKIIDGINSRNDVFDYEVIGSLGIPDIGRRIFKKILDIYNIDELIEISYNGQSNKLTKIGGIKEKTAEKIMNGINRNIELINFLRSQLNVKRDTRKYTIKVAFTKVRDKEFETYLDSKDVLVMDSYNKNVDMLIVPNYQTDSSKVTKARKDGKEIVSIDDAYKMFQYNK